MSVSQKDKEIAKALKLSDFTKVAAVGSIQLKSGQSYEKNFIQKIASAVYSLVYRAQGDDPQSRLYAQSALDFIMSDNASSAHWPTVLNRDIQQITEKLMAGGNAPTGHTIAVCRDLLTRDEGGRLVFNADHIKKQISEDAQEHFGLKVDLRGYPYSMSIGAPQARP